MIECVCVCVCVCVSEGFSSGVVVHFGFLLSDLQCRWRSVDVECSFMVVMVMMMMMMMIKRRWRK